MEAKTGMLFDTDKWLSLKKCNPRGINFLVIHLGLTNQSLDCNTAEALSAHLRKSPTQYSAHICIDQNNIIRCFEDHDIAYGCDDFDNQHVGIQNGIQIQLVDYEFEVCNAKNTSILENLANVVAQYCMEYSIPTIKLKEEAVDNKSQGITLSHVCQTNPQKAISFPWSDFLKRVEFYKHQWVLITEIKDRREKNKIPLSAPRLGLAFSGGGIRSATFCLGLARALAKNKILNHFDYLSTVSGGGYVGSAIGRLYKNDNAKAVSDGLANDNSLFLWWLRRNGRFLMPAGALDVLSASAGYLRGLFAIQWEVGVLLSLISLFIVIPHLLSGCTPTLRELGMVISMPWWSFLLFFIPCITTMNFAFWFARDKSIFEPQHNIKQYVLISIMLVISLSTISIINLIELSIGQKAVLLSIAASLLGLPIGALLASQCYKIKENSEEDQAPEKRVRFTHGLGYSLLIMLILVVIGCFDLLTWILAENIAHEGFGLLYGGAGGTAFLIVMLRTIIPAAEKFSPQGEISFLSPQTLANIAGLLLSVLLLVLWLSAVQWLVFFCPWFLGEEAFTQENTVYRWGILCISALGYIWITGQNVDQLNRSSLYAFYRSRLARAYISVGNPEKIGNPLDIASKLSTQIYKKVVVASVNDDIELGKYQPHKYGGPIHLINICINQTTDDRTGMYNADRKGINLTVSSLGIEIGTELPNQPDWTPPRAFTDFYKNSMLSQWIAISGAAVGSGMGSITKPGLSALTFLTGARLGYWLPWGQSTLSFALKYRTLLREWFGFFPGLNKQKFDELHSANLYLSDGGHFDNTGVYTLLKRHAKFILLADCGADPDYRFEDLESLIRKARIDYQAQIEIIDPSSLDAAQFVNLSLECFGTPDSIDPSPGDAFLLLARIKYSSPYESMGTLLVVKPRRLKKLPIDIAGYSDRDLSFPQQTTGDQFFDEAQWESYCELGRILGDRITDKFIDDIQIAASIGNAAATRSLSDGHGAVAGQASRRERFSPAVRQSIGIGAVLGAGIAFWQVVENQQISSQSADAAEKKTLDFLLNPVSSTALGENMIDWAIDGRSMGDDKLKKVINRLEDFGALHGSSLQDSATLAVAKAVLARCMALTPMSDGVQNTVTYTQCVKAIVSLTQTRGTWLHRGLWHYQDESMMRNTPKLPSLSETCVGNLQVLIYDNDTKQRLQVKQIQKGIESIGIPTRKASSPFLALLGGMSGSSSSLAAEGNAARQMLLISHPHDADCAEQIVSYIKSHKLQQASLLEPASIPMFQYGIGKMHLVLLKTSSVPKHKQQDNAQNDTDMFAMVLNDTLISPKYIDEPALTISKLNKSGLGALNQTPDSSYRLDHSMVPSDAGLSDQILASTKKLKLQDSRTLYIQFQGAFQRENVNELRRQLEANFSGDANQLNVPAAERIGGNYPNIVKYFQPQTRADAEAVTNKVNELLFKTDISGCKLKSPVTMIEASAPNDPPHLELWITPSCRQPK